MTRQPCLTSVCLLALYLSGPAGAGEALKAESLTTSWPLVRGNPLQDGVARADLPDKLETLWTFKARDAIEGAAAIADGTVYVGSYDGSLYAIDLATGKERWRYEAGPLKAAPSVHKDAVYVGDEEGVFHCVDRATGLKRWTFETNGEITASANFAGGNVLIGSYDSTLYCLSPAGKKLWEVVTEGPVNGSPAVVGDRTFVAGCDSQLHVIDVRTGKELGAVDLGGQAAATAAVRGDHLYVGTMSDQLLAVNWKEPGVLWTFEPKKRAQAFFASAAVTDRLVIVGNRNRKLYAVERETGKPVWEFETGGRVDPSPVVVGSRVYAPSLDGKLYVLDVAGGKEVQQVPLGRAVAASPAVASNRLVIGSTDGVLYCLGRKE